MTRGPRADLAAELDGLNMEPPPDMVEEDYWDRCHLHRIATDPPRYVLTLPSGQKVPLTTAHFFDLTKFRIAFVDAAAHLPPLPEKGAAPFLQLVLERLLERRTDEEACEEAGDHGTLLDDIRTALSACPQADDPEDVDRGAVFVPAPGAPAWVNGRLLLSRVARGCPVKFSPAEFYVALSELSIRNVGVVRSGGWRGRVWAVPLSLVPSLTLPADTPVMPEPEQTHMLSQ